MIPQKGSRSSLQRQYSWDIIPPKQGSPSSSAPPTPSAKPGRRVIVVKLFGCEFSDPTSLGNFESIMCSFRLLGEERRVWLSALDGTERLVWNVPDNPPSLDLMLRISRKRLFVFSPVATCGPIPVEQLGLDNGPLNRKFPLFQKGTRVGKIHLEFSAAYDSPELVQHLDVLHNIVVAKLCGTFGRKGSRSRRNSLALSSHRKDSILSDPSTSNVPGGYLSPDEVPDGVVGYTLDLNEFETAFLSSECDISVEPRVQFPWVIDPPPRLMSDSVADVQASWVRIQEEADVTAMVDLFYATAAHNPGVALLFRNTDWAAQKQKLTMALKLALDNLHEPDTVLPVLKELAIKHVDYGVELDHYNDIGNALMVAIASADPKVEEDDKLRHAWELTYTLIATSMMEATRPYYMRKGQLPPGLELLGGDGAFPPLFYQFNERFQAAVQDIWADETNLGAWRRLSDVCDDFEACAQTLGRIIISEQFVSAESRTIKPLSTAGGLIGGVKYCEQGVFFKFAAPDGKYIRSCKAAEKVAGNELKHCSSYFQAGIKGLHVPLVSLIDYAGFRLVATCVLPISSDTLVVGTNDGGKTIHGDDRKLLHILEKAGVFLNLKKHMVGTTLLPAAADLEGHYSPTDKRYYLLDFSRAFPPDIESVYTARTSEAIYSRLLRPEMVMRCGANEPLNPDVFSGFRGTGGEEDDNDFKADCAAVQDVSKSIKQQCQSLVIELERLILGKQDSLQDVVDFVDSFSRQFHFYGVNMRYLGLMSSLCQTREMQSLLYVEMAARVIKHHIRAQWRRALSSAGYSVVSSLRRVAASILSDMLSLEPTFWRTKVFPVLEEYFQVLWPVEASDSGDSENSDEKRDPHFRVSMSSFVVVSAGNASPFIRTRERSKSTGTLQKVQMDSSQRRLSEARRVSATPREPLLQHTTSGNSLLEEEQNWKSLDQVLPRGWRARGLSVLLHRVCQMTGIQLSGRLQRVVRELTGVRNIRVEGSDFASIEPRCKSMNIAAQGRAMHLSGEAHKSKSGETLSMAIDHFDSALNGPLVSGGLLASYAVCLSHAPDALTSLDKRNHIDSLFDQAIALCPSDPEIRIKLALWREQSNLEEAHVQWLRALSTASSDVVASHAAQYVDVLWRLGNKGRAKEVQESLKQYLQRGSKGLSLL